MTEQIDSCLKLSKGSWHYKMLLILKGGYYFYHYDKKQKRLSLCKYFWTVVIGIFQYPFTVMWRSLPLSIQDHDEAGKAIGVWLAICIVIEIVSRIIDPSWWWVGFTVFFIGLAFVGVIVGAISLFEFLEDKNYERQMKRRIERKPSLFKEFIKAKKNKVCPCIEFVDEVKK